MNIRITLYSREKCHLCDVMLKNIHDFIQFDSDEINIINIDTDPALIQKYGARIPVLVINGIEACHGHYDANAVENILNQETTSSQ